ncbi:hypothetical protein EDD86DRAFT_264015 [Gorgonomyces haynaldii]|nr:hypothetical protein EDD86DRAFT_264015 [Gorgonomyces haynaldii]
MASTTQAPPSITRTSIAPTTSVPPVTSQSPSPSLTVPSSPPPVTSVVQSPSPTVVIVTSAASPDPSTVPVQVVTSIVGATQSAPSSFVPQFTATFSTTVRSSPTTGSTTDTPSTAFPVAAVAGSIAGIIVLILIGLGFFAYKTSRPKKRSSDVSLAMQDAVQNVNPRIVQVGGPTSNLSRTQSFVYSEVSKDGRPLSQDMTGMDQRYNRYSQQTSDRYYSTQDSSHLLDGYYQDQTYHGQQYSDQAPATTGQYYYDNTYYAQDYATGSQVGSSQFYHGDEEYYYVDQNGQPVIIEDAYQEKHQ